MNQKAGTNPPNFRPEAFAVCSLKSLPLMALYLL